MCSFIIVTPVPIPRWLRGKKKKKKNLPANTRDAADTGLILGSG